MDEEEKAQLKLALSIISGREDSLDVREFELLGLNESYLCQNGNRVDSYVKEQAERIVYDLIIEGVSR